MQQDYIDSNLKILIVDNEKDRVRSLKSMLKNLGYRNIFEESNCDHAIIKLDEVSGYRLIFLNWDMGEGVALKFLKNVRVGPLKNEVKIIMQTEVSDQETILSAVKAGANRCIIKPVLPKTIEHVLMTLMEESLASAKKQTEKEVEAVKQQMLQAKEEKDRIANIYYGGATEMLAALEFFPWKAFGHYEVSLAYQKAGEMSHVVTALMKALKLEETHKQACHVLAGILLQRKQWYKAIRLLVPFVVHKPFPDLFQQLGEAYIAVGEINKAIKAFNDSIFYSKEIKNRSKRELAKRHEGLGKAYQGKAEETGEDKWQKRSINQFEESIEIDSTLVSAHLNLVQAYKRAGEQEKAIQALKNAATITPNDSNGWVSLGDLYLQENATDKASFAFKRAIQMSEAPQQTFYEIAECYADRDIDFALKFLKRSAQLDAKQPHVWNKLGIISRKQGLIDEALEDYQHALELDPDDEVIHFNFARACLDKNEENSRREAITHLSEALRLRPDFDEVKKLLEKIK